MILSKKTLAYEYIYAHKNITALSHVKLFMHPVESHRLACIRSFYP
jgi:hypothetical protein